jgi:outer membrane protein assembly factor BamB
MNYMNYIRDPSSVYETIPAALPPEFFPAYQNRRSPPKEETAPPKPVDPFPSVMWNVQVSDESLNDIINLNDTIFVIDNNGKVSAIDQDAAELWSFDGDANAVTALDDRTAVIANDKMTLLNGTDGAVRGEYAFTWGAVPNAKPVQVPGGIALATLRGVTICRQSNAQVIREIPVSGGIVSSLVLADTELVGINGAGSLIIMNVSAGSIRLEIPLGLGTNILAPRYLNGIIYAANENGRITAVEIESGAKLWETELGAGLSIEPELDAERVYAWTTDKTLIRLSSANGNPVGNPILNVESAPLLFNGKLYWGGKGSTLVVADSSTGRILKSNPIPDSVSVRPLIVGNNLFVGTQSGRLIKVRSEFL